MYCTYNKKHNNIKTSTNYFFLCYNLNNTFSIYIFFICLTIFYSCLCTLCILSISISSDVLFVFSFISLIPSLLFFPHVYLFMLVSCSPIRDSTGLKKKKKKCLTRMISFRPSFPSSRLLSFPPTSSPFLPPSCVNEG